MFYTLVTVLKGAFTNTSLCLTAFCNSHVIIIIVTIIILCINNLYCNRSYINLRYGEAIYDNYDYINLRLLSNKKAHNYLA